MGARTVPVLAPDIQMPAPSPGDPMEITTSANPSAPPSAARTPDRDDSGAPERLPAIPHIEQPLPDNIVMPAPAAAAAAIHQPKIVQTAFIHKLYSMLEDGSISHLISWTPPGESFVMQPSHEFSKVLAQYFKHTNISSFVRQLNMYGFHKVSDVFHHGGPETAMWEFKHGNGSFRKGDVAGLREIKRRASRHALVHREYNHQKPPAPQPGTPAETVPSLQGGGEPRAAVFEHMLYDMSARLQRSEENTHLMHIRQQAMMDALTRLVRLNHELSRSVLALAPSPDNPIHREIVALQSDIQRQTDALRSLGEMPDATFPSNRPFFGPDNVPISPRQLAQDDPRRPSLSIPQNRTPYYYRSPVRPSLSVNTRRPYGSIGTGTAHPSPSTLRTQIPPPPPSGLHPLANVEVPPNNLPRRHTSADIRANGWQPNPPPFVSSGPASSHWPSSPGHAGGAESQTLRDTLSTYSLQNASQSHSPRPATPPGPPADNFNGWSWGTTNRADNRHLSLRDSSGPPTRRGSMAHILNPTENTQEDDEDSSDPRREEDRSKRQRTQ